MDSSVYAMYLQSHPICRHCGAAFVEGQDQDGNAKTWHLSRDPIRFRDSRALDAHHTPEVDPDEEARMRELLG